MESHKSPNACGKGFTLTEILVVITIIVVLALVTLSITQRMIASAKSTKCMSNLRQMHTIATLQVVDLGSYPGMGSQAKDENGSVTNKGDDFYSLVGYPPPDCVSCPAAKYTGFHPTAKPARPISAYGANPMVMPNSVNNNPPLVKPHQITRPSQVILMADGAQFKLPNPRALGFLAAWWTSGKGDPKSSEKSVTTALVSDGGFWDNEVSQIPLRHNGKANLIFCDGHAIQISRLGELKEKNLYWNY